MTDLANPTATWPEQWPPITELAGTLASYSYTHHDFVQGARLIAQGGFDLPLDVALRQAWRQSPGTFTAYAERLLRLIGVEQEQEPPEPTPTPTPRPQRGPFLADKECSACGAKPAEFYVNAAVRDGLTSQCAPCLRKQTRNKQRAAAILRDRHWQEYEQILKELA